jgi:hypothetical protein
VTDSGKHSSLLQHGRKRFKEVAAGQPIKYETF